MNKALEWIEKRMKKGGGDCKIDVVGFSRGAAAARHFVNQVQPLLKKYPGWEIRFIGVWDTVAAIGLFSNDEGELDLTLPDGLQKRAYHALALNERRGLFEPNRYPGAKEVWFLGGHSDVGGGYPKEERGLANVSLYWMVQNALRHDVPINESAASLIKFDPSTFKIHDLAGDPAFRFNSLFYKNGHPRKILNGDTFHSSFMTAEYWSDGDTDQKVFNSEVVGWILAPGYRGANNLNVDDSDNWASQVQQDD